MKIIRLFVFLLPVLLISCAKGHLSVSERENIKAIRISKIVIKNETPLFVTQGQSISTYILGGAGAYLYEKIKSPGDQLKLFMSENNIDINELVRIELEKQLIAKGFSVSNDNYNAEISIYVGRYGFVSSANLPVGAIFTEYLVPYFLVEGILMRDRATNSIILSVHGGFHTCASDTCKSLPPEGLLSSPTTLRDSINEAIKDGVNNVLSDI